MGRNVKLYILFKFNTFPGGEYSIVQMLQYVN